METYHAEVTRGSRYWIVRVLELERATQARHLREMEAMTRDLISTMTGAPADAFRIEFDLRLPESVQAHLRASQELRTTASRAQAEATAETRAAARELLELGMPLRDIARAIGVSFQRVHQLVKT